MREIEGVSESAPSLDDAVRAARLEFAFGNHPSSLVASVLLAALTTIMLSGSGDRAVWLAWLGALTLVNLVRFLQYRRYRAQQLAGTVDLVAWERTLFLGCLIGGGIWGVSALLFLPQAADQRFFLAFVLAGVSAGAVTGLSVALRAALAFVVPCVLPLALLFLAEGDLLHVVMGIMALLYIGLTVSVARRGDAQLRQMVLSQINASAAEESRQITLERLRIATHAGRIGIWEWNLGDGTLVWDKQMYETYRLAEGEPAPRYEMWRQRVHPQDIARVESQLNAAIAGAEDFNSEFRIVWPEGQERIVRTAASVVRDKQGRAVSLTGISLDITELKRVERMKSEFVSVVSHELRTPLTSIRGSLGLVANEAAGPVPDKVKEILALADRNAQRLGLLIDDLLDIEKLEAGKLRFNSKAQDLAPLIKQALSANLHYALRSQVELAFSGAWPAVVVAVDGMRLLQVMTNLLSNAVKFSPSGSTVEISTTALEDNRVRVAVRDRGRGISPDFQPKVFSKFSQGDSSDVRAVGGTGLGLAISKALIEQMNGAIGFETVPGSGTTFYFDLPTCDPAVVGAEPHFSHPVSA